MKKIIFTILITCLALITKAQWVETNGPPDTIPTFVYDIVIDGQYIFAGTDGEGVFLSTDSGNTWTAKNNGLNLSLSHLNEYNGVLYAGTSLGGYMSSDSGATWVNISQTFAYALWQIVAKDSAIFATSWEHGVLVSYDTGATWNGANNGLTSAYTENLYLYGNDLYVSTDDSGVFRSSDNGASWHAISSAIPGYGEPVGYASAIVFMGSNLIAAVPFMGVYLSTDSGASWKSMNNGLDTTVGDVFELGSYILASSNSGIYLSADTCKHWRTIEEIWPDPTVGNVVSFAANNTTVFIGTGVEIGVWKRAISDIKPCNANFTIAADTSQLHHYIVTDNSVGYAPILYDWNWGDGTHDSVPYPNHTFADSGFYSVCVTIKDNIGCVSSYCDSSFHAMRTTDYMVSASVIPSPGIAPIAFMQSTDSTICMNNCINFKDESMNGTSWQWQFPGADTPSSTLQNPQNICYSAPGSYDVTFQVQNYSGTDIRTYANFVHVFSNPPAPQITQSNDTLFSNSDSSYSSFQWYKDSVLLPGETNPFIVITNGTNYIVKVTNGAGCSATAGINVILKADNEDPSNPFILMPNPVHDNLFIFPKEKIENFKISIFDILGKRQKPYIQTQGDAVLVNMQNFASGIYIIQIVSEQNSLTRKLVKD